MATKFQSPIKAEAQKSEIRIEFHHTPRLVSEFGEEFQGCKVQPTANLEAARSQFAEISRRLAETTERHIENWLQLLGNTAKPEQVPALDQETINEMIADYQKAYGTDRNLKLVTSAVGFAIIDSQTERALAIYQITQTPDGNSIKVRPLAINPCIAEMSGRKKW